MGLPRSVQTLRGPVCIGGGGVAGDAVLWLLDPRHLQVPNSLACQLCCLLNLPGEKGRAQLSTLGRADEGLLEREPVTA